MSAVRDPAFWRRFSVAILQDEEAQYEKSMEKKVKRPELKHSYVATLSVQPNPPSTFINMDKYPNATATAVPSPSPSPLQSPQSSSPEIQQPARALQHLRPSQQPQQPQPPPSPSSSPQPFQSPTTLRSPPTTHTRPIYSRRNTSTLTLGLSGRPASRGFHFWTSIEANPANRESWLEEQRRKKSKRTCMCWCFWSVFAVFVAGIVITVMMLKGQGIL